MKRFVPHLWVALLSLGLVLLLPARAWAHGPADGGASTSDINTLFTVVFWISVPVFVLVEGLILYAIVRSIRARRTHRDGEPEQIEGNTPLELTWTVLAFVIVGVLFVLTYRFMSTKYYAEADVTTTTPDLTVQVTGYLYNWDYDYFLGDSTEPDTTTSVRTTRTLTIPANRNVLLKISSSDVQHSFWVPKLAGKVDAVPGYTNTMWLNVKEPGLYTGNCAEYCGTLHWNMLIDVEVLEPAAFDVWLAERMAAAGKFIPIGTDLETPLPAGDAEAGLAAFNALGCAACHGALPGAGPALSQIAQNAAGMVSQGYESPEAYLRESILLPCENQYPGYNCQIMPANYGEKLDAQDLADLIEYLKSYTE